jgi:hypothetical protein
VAVVFGSTIAAAALTALFAVTGLYSLARIVVPRIELADRASYALHAAMSAAMIAMAWPWGLAVPPVVHVLVFSAAALYYLQLLVFRPATPAGPGDVHHGGRLLLGYHVGMMTSMVWMGALMSLLGHGPEGGHAHHGAVAAPASADAAAAVAAPGGWPVALNLGWAVFFAVAAVGLVVRLVRTRDRSRLDAGDSVVSLVMAAGMAASFALS